MGNEDWRRRRAEELFGNGRGQASRSGRESRFASDDDVLPMAPISDKREPRPSTPFDHWAVSAYRARSRSGAESPLTPPVATAPIASRQAPPSPSTVVATPALARRGIPLWALLAAIALIIAGAVGWLVRGSFGAPVAPPVASVALPAVQPRPRTLPLSTATAPPEAQTPKAADPQAAVPVPSAPERMAAVTPDAGSLRTDRSRDHAPVATDRAKVRHVNPKGHALSGTGRGREKEHPTDKRALETQRAPVATPQHRATTTRDRSETTRAAGINCRRARNDVTAAICSDAGLAALDRQLTSRFATLDRSADLATVQRIHHGETTFLNARQSCQDRECIARSYRQRLRELDPY